MKKSREGSERLLKNRALSDEELEKVSGGASRGSPVNELPDDGGCGGEIGSGK